MKVNQKCKAPNITSFFWLTFLKEAPYKLFFQGTLWIIVTTYSIHVMSIVLTIRYIEIKAIVMDDQKYFFKDEH